MPKKIVPALVLSLSSLCFANDSIAIDWTPGRLWTDIVPVEKLQPMVLERSERLIWKSNNPEVVLGEGWLMQHARQDAQRGGEFKPLTGCFDAYLFHINKSGSRKFVHLVGSNPNPTPLTVTLRGSMYNNWESPLNGAGTGPSFETAHDWLSGSLRLSQRTQVIEPNRALELTYLNMASMVDGRYEICTDKPILLYSVATNNGDPTLAENLTQGRPADGIIAPSDRNRYGREAGVYHSSEYRGHATLRLPANFGYTALALNTSAKFQDFLQEQTSDALMHLSDSSDRTHGNYGHLFQVNLMLENDHPTKKTVKISFTSNVTQAGPSFTYNGSVQVNDKTHTVYLTPTLPYQYIGEFTVPPNTEVPVDIRFYVPGLITTNHQLVVESLN